MSDRTNEFDTDIESDNKSFVSHLIELRKRIFKALACIFLFLLVLMTFSDQLYLLLAEPLLKSLPDTSSMIATQVASPFLAPFKLTLFVAFFISVPYVFYQVWAFVAPGLYKEERHLGLPLMVSTSLLFYLGGSFAYFAGFPLGFSFFTGIVPTGVTVMTDISQYLDFVLKLFFAFGIAFEVPVATYLLIRSGLVSIESLSAKRPYIIVGAFSLGMLLTPPDIISQVMLGVPMWLLFEVGIYLCRLTLVDDKNEKWCRELKLNLCDLCFFHFFDEVE